ncbi:PH domain-containing protein [Antrihabitans cavernicola]|uniref:PH domain-containing protein n=1 Tax=Antrihabitans cavernicola TaxID=2495913 RepID=A0A5A7SH74_9NOCA|nr:PH domain-containing protein [Spelaeibacter cavernicola]KAA0023541.1 PH domain-containing protein [Spelaeibacter cavernicola]
MSEYELDVRSRKTARFALGIAVFLIVVFTVSAVLLRGTGTGVYFRPSDQVAMVFLGLLLAGGVSLLARPRLRADAAGVRVRNAFSEKTLDWSVVRGLTFPDGAAWARIELPDDEYVPVLAIQANDRERAVDAVRRFRALGAKYSTAV